MLVDLPLRQIAITAFLVLLILSGCSSLGYEKEAGDNVQKFHQEFNAKRFDKIYALADESYKGNLTEQQSTDFFRNLHDRLGKVNREALYSVNTDISPDGVTVTMVYRTDFEAGQYSEQFIWSINDNKIRLVRYDINY